jgi:hypothetical protein
VAGRNPESSGGFYEHRTHGLLPWPLFLRRAALHLVVGVAVIFTADAIGTIGYHLLGRQAWVDAFLNASMILSGMGPVDPLPTGAAKIFAACYALFSGVIFIGLMGVVLAPWAHRMLHWMHMDEGGESS